MEILFRKGVLPPSEEKQELAHIPNPIFYRAQIRPGQTIVPRFYLWPYPQEVLMDIRLMGAIPINDAQGTRWCRDIEWWTQTLGNATPKTMPWDQWIRSTADIPVVLKSREKSFKERWGTHMFAPDRAASLEVFRRIVDAGVDPGDVFVREYVPLKELEPNPVGGPPITEEYRLFILDGNVMASGFYWSNSELNPDPGCVPVPTNVISNISVEIPGLRFYVLDVARTASGDWIIVEVNDGCSAGLSKIDPGVFYTRLLNAGRTL